MKILILGARRRLPFICEEDQPQEDNRLGKGMAHQRTATAKHRSLTLALFRPVTRSRISSEGQENQTMLTVKEVISRDPEVLGGTPVFRGTRVPFQALLDYLEGDRH
jgi:hypothetical protein